MLKALLATAALASMLVSAQAEVYNYACKVDNTPPNNSVHISAKIDTKAKTLTWRGKTFKNLKTSGTGGLTVEDCAKYCFEATYRNLTVFVSTATQGVASLEVSDGHAPLENVECDLVRD